ncbi:putative transporter, Major facilitator superfamily MFS_1 [Cupriavidus taiwanensis]|uniref:Transporter, Major facilitator superfamily MFS_1 n=1 Tax=Cupriavidus taiwanensis TaxID=164546 RepID=A0A976G1V2_9BURK|nr:MFS transporter [Cupriavidus taiwanensis]SOZ13810.1 putative transporter, Major facilitator superfamily MFS_1 [Cupriavidus taiwanensis]SOZ24148.1 putative transporter, Major facilitator superfamily MFS_1 [Cupriavidus taiwanensis]SOZ44421.1 putative transporter, Major facilitator superfamily MFS_1 [Cupriavidus taiwanensis]SOZ55023.1 putative transporter, Major facilitator superfamily MFS_1 [Cupriavidus taiwanensis]SOZ55971.1 putative transporter, Major facilitator superfamily MFS_1 [Cupriavi
MTLTHAAVPPITWLIALTVCNHVAFNASRVVVSLFAISLKASTVTLGVLMSLYALLPMLLAIRAGKRIDQIGPRKPMMAGSLMVVAGTLLPALWHELGALYLSCALIGVGFMLVQVAMQLLIGQVSTDATRLRNYTWHALGLSVSGTIGPVAMGYVIEHAGFRPAFAVLVVVALAGQAGLQWVRPRLPARGGNAGRIAIADGTRHSTLDLLQHPELRAVFVASAVLSAAWDLHAFLIPIQGSRIGLSPSSIGWVLGAFAIATFAIRVAMPAVSRRLSEWKIIRAALLVGALAYLAYPFVAHFWLMCALAFVLGLALGSAQPNVMNILHTASPHGRAGEALGLRSAVLNTSQVVWPLTFGVVGTALGMLPIFLSMAGAMGAAGYYSRRQGRKALAPPAQPTAGG